MNRFTDGEHSAMRPLAGRVDVHQHLWPPALVDALRRRTTPPLLRGWILHTAGEPPFEVRAADHDPGRRAALDAGAARVLVSLSTPLGIEALPPADAQPLLDAWHAGVRELPPAFAGWAASCESEPDLDGLEKLLGSGFVGLQVSAGLLADPAAVESAAPLLRVCERRARPVLVHPGPVRAAARRTPPPWPASWPAWRGWWPAVVDYPAQLQAAWWAWQVAGRSLLPELRICFAAGAGLAPVHHERFVARSGERLAVDRDVFVDISSYARQGVDALARALGIDVLVLGSDRPYAAPPDPEALHLGDAARFAVCVANPTRLLDGGDT